MGTRLTINGTVDGVYSFTDALRRLADEADARGFEHATVLSSKYGDAFTVTLFGEAEPVHLNVDEFGEE